MLFVFVGGLLVLHFFVVLFVCFYLLLFSFVCYCLFMFVSVGVSFFDLLVFVLDVFGGVHLCCSLCLLECFWCCDFLFVLLFSVSLCLF